MKQPEVTTETQEQTKAQVLIGLIVERLDRMTFIELANLLVIVEKSPGKRNGEKK